jgi:hypothetical protein
VAVKTPGNTVKLVEDVPVPKGVVTEIAPVVLPRATVAVICVSLSTTNEAAGVPLNWTAAAPVKFVPLIVTELPTPPDVGVKLVITGAGTTVKLDDVAVPPGVVTVIAPVVAPAGTVVLICVSETTVKVALTPWKNLTLEAFVKPLPVSVTGNPTPAPPAGEYLVITGVGTTVKLDDVAVPPGVVTVIAPVVALAGTVVLI